MHDAALMLTRRRKVSCAHFCLLLLVFYLKCNFIQETLLPSFFKLYYEFGKDEHTPEARQIFDATLRG